MKRVYHNEVTSISSFLTLILNKVVCLTKSFCGLLQRIHTFYLIDSKDMFIGPYGFFDACKSQFNKYP
jgi:hypothetical protein